MTDHEPHGICLECFGPVHRYPMNWAHVNRAELPDGRTCTNDVPARIRVTCCKYHGATPPLGAVGNIRADQLQPGDQWKEVLVLAVEELPADEYYPNGRIRVEGKIGSRKKPQHWTFHPSQPLDIERVIISD